ncbi:tetraspanin2 [Hibiscus trionum]|uniref:Tetraspanin2 n=1 Tax=Hibiscus trionum TaxID=183268 RepID=A0A9W7J3C4_HIBTR|nr:tetraspanin2 [Hibiscus trionum]
MGVANNVTAVLNFIAIICSIPIIAAGIWLAQQPDNGCIHLFRWPVLLLGLLILLVSLAGFVGAFRHKETLLAFYLCCMAILIGLLLILLVFAFIVTRSDGSYAVPGISFKEYRLDGYSGWLRNHVVDSKSWNKIRACLSDTDICPKLTQQFITADQFFASHMSPLQSGCCKPPTICGYTFVNPTLWTNPANPTGDPDCNLWSNDQTQLCYNCNSCKAGMLGNLRREWRKANIILIVAVVVLICVYIIACSAFKNVQTEDLFRRYKYGWT